MFACFSTCSSTSLTFVGLQCCLQKAVPSLFSQLRSETAGWPSSAKPACWIKQLATLETGLCNNYSNLYCAPSNRLIKEGCILQLNCCCFQIKVSSLCLNSTVNRHSFCRELIPQMHCSNRTCMFSDFQSWPLNRKVARY